MTASRRVPLPGGIGLHLLEWDGAGGDGGQARRPAGVGAPAAKGHGAGKDRGQVAFLLVHGLASNARLWEGVAERLHLLGHRVAAVDQRGHGLSDKPDDGYDLATAVADLAAVVRWLGPQRPVLVGQSWGGNVVLELAAREPGLARGVALVDGGWLQLADRFPEWEECATALAPPSSEGLSWPALDRKVRTAHPSWPDAGIRGTMANYEVGPDGAVAARLGREHHLRLLRALWEHHPSTRYADLAVPVLLVPAADPDEPYGWDEAVKEAEATISRVGTRRLAGDHDLHAQHPDALARLLHGCVADGFFA